MRDLNWTNLNFSSFQHLLKKAQKHLSPLTLHTIILSCQEKNCGVFSSGIWLYNTALLLRKEPLLCFGFWISVKFTSCDYNLFEVINLNIIINFAFWR